MLLPRHFCWTRFGPEAGERVGEIFARKEKERLLNGGIFLWGIGNALGPSMRQLLRFEKEPVVVFSPIRSAPRKEDVAPDQVVMWTAGRTLDGQHYELPAASVVTSRSKFRARRTSHYALVCASSLALQINLEGERVRFRELRNLLTNRPLGPSQVTAIVRQTCHDLEPSTTSYPAAMQVQLVYPYFIELTRPRPLSLERPV